MTKELSVEKGNRLIAVYMGWEFGRYSNTPNRCHKYFGSEEVGMYIKNATYHSSWNALMDVVDDIYYSRRFPTGAQTTEVSSKPHRLWLEIKNGLVNLSKEQVWQAVVQFIIWYNNTQTKKQ